VGSMSTEGAVDCLISDTEAAIRAVLNKVTKSSLCPRLVFKHQIYEIITNKTEVICHFSIIIVIIMVLTMIALN
jgi:hypothetical protein